MTCRFHEGRKKVGTRYTDPNKSITGTQNYFWKNNGEKVVGTNYRGGDEKRGKLKRDGYKSTLESVKKKNGSKTSWRRSLSSYQGSYLNIRTGKLEGSNNSRTEGEEDEQVRANRCCLSIHIHGLGLSKHQKQQGS